jgi:hypothetical protein
MCLSNIQKHATTSWVCFIAAIKLGNYPFTFSIPKSHHSFQKQKKDSLSVIPNEFLFIVGRHTGGAPMDSEHRFRAEGLYYQ